MVPKHFTPRLGAALVTLMALALPGRSGAEMPPLDVSAARFAPGMDGVCSSGQKLSEGCDAIRARGIVDATAPPWRTLGRVNFASIAIRTHCTGALVSERIVLTAAHCLYNGARKSWIPAQSITFAAGYERGKALAVSKVARYVLDPVHDLQSREFLGGVADDWALLILDDPVGRTTGYLDILAGNATASPARIAGYPALRPHVLSVADDCGDMHAAAGGRVLLAGCSIMQGDSGAPFLAVHDDRPRVVGILSAARVDGAQIQSLGVPVSAFSEALHRELQR